MIQIQQFRFNPLGVNTWILFDEEGIGIVVDPAMHTSTEFEQFHKFIRDRNIQLKMVINTHGHFDHVPGVAGVVDKYHCHYLVHTAETGLLSVATRQAAVFGFNDFPDPPSPDRLLHDGEWIEEGKIRMQVKHIPGHSPGSIALYLPNPGVVISGDVLFKGSIGRTDLPGGDFDQLIRGIQTQLLILPGETRVLCGHGPETTIEAEKSGNPFLVESGDIDKKAD